MLLVYDVYTHFGWKKPVMAMERVFYMRLQTMLFTCVLTANVAVTCRHFCPRHTFFFLSLKASLLLLF